MPLINPPIDREFCDFCRDLAAIFFTFGREKCTAWVMGHSSWWSPYHW